MRVKKMVAPHEPMEGALEGDITAGRVDAASPLGVAKPRSRG